MDTSEWEIAMDDIQICQSAEGVDIVVGRGTFGKVIKALKGGVQVDLSINWIRLESNANFVVGSRLLGDSDLWFEVFDCVLEDDISLLA